ncbi:hypothetical protein D7B24_008185 [Verticillium nonalfalfae]|uniref:C2H2-type domain-containing protein n=1 Tax=Verticillium nonalfalfae TaxID=1051616 RepID=A0A3M9Y5M1_9PEZI|nr:uncharacterized protein D7B24_008185 [Verticillium nonalfalfae]RNJ55757.1 hypothetical protein D7B24_008185 [Verticillium nonalfalfae]
MQQVAMSDVRALLRQQRGARRIDHPFAAYSDAGKLLCTLCHEAVKAESLWDAHLRGSRHTDKSQKLRASQKTRTTTIEEQTNGTHKRKHDADLDDEDATMVDATARKKRSRNDMNTRDRSGSENSSDSAGETSRDQEIQPTKDQTLTPPTLNRRTSTTPVQGGEMLIPSRPATPHHRDGTSSTATPLGPSPLIPQDPIAPSGQPDDAVSTVTAQQKVDEDEWAAFEADMAAESMPYADDAVISAPAMTAEEHAANARTEEEEREKRRLAAEKDVADEKEEATRALETEFEEMEELEARVRKLKERREALRSHADVTDAEKVEPPAQKATVTSPTGKGKGDDEEDGEEEGEDDDDDDEDDFMGFRFGG